MERHLRLVKLQVGRQRQKRGGAPAGYDDADAFQEGCLGLAQAMLQHNDRKDVHFASFALARIHRAISEGVVERRGMIGVPARLLRRRRRAARRDNARHDPRDSHGRIHHPRICSSYAMNALADRHPTGAGSTTISQLARQRCAELANAIAQEMIIRGRYARADRNAVIMACLNERWLIEHESCRTPLRDLAARFTCSLGRVTHYEKRFRTRLAAWLQTDAVIGRLAQYAGTHRAGMNRPLTSEEIRELSELMSGPGHLEPGNAQDD